MRPFSLIYRPAVIQDDLGELKPINLRGYGRSELWRQPRYRAALQRGLHRASITGPSAGIVFGFIGGAASSVAIVVYQSIYIYLIVLACIILLSSATSPRSDFGCWLIRRRRIDIIRPILKVGVCPCCVYDLRRIMTAVDAERTPYVTCPECGASWLRGRQWE